MKRYLLIIGAFGLVVAILAWTLLAEDRISRASIGRVQIGMTRDEAIAILGPPNSVMSNMPLDSELIIDEETMAGDWHEPLGGFDMRTLSCWQGRRCGLTIRVDPQDRIIGTVFIGARRLTLFEKLRGALGL